MRFLRLPEVTAKLAISRSHLYSLVDQGLLPKPIPLGARAVAWLEHEIDEMMILLMNDGTEKQRRELVITQRQARAELLKQLGLRNEENV